MQRRGPIPLSLPWPCRAAQPAVCSRDPRRLRLLLGACFALGLLGAAAGAQPLPDPGQPAARPGLFERLFDRREHLRRSAPLRARVEAAEDAAEQARERADEARRRSAPPPLQPRPFAPLPEVLLDDRQEQARRAASAAERARQRSMQDRLQRFLDSAARADSLALEAGAAAARAARAGTIARGTDRLQAGAAAGRSRVGDRPALGPRPLVRMPRVELE